MAMNSLLGWISGSYGGEYENDFRNVASCSPVQTDRRFRSAYFLRTINTLLGEILGSHGGEYEDDCLLGCCTTNVTAIQIKMTDSRPGNSPKYTRCCALRETVLTGEVRKHTWMTRLLFPVSYLIYILNDSIHN
jgi:hypothetical protein